MGALEAWCRGESSSASCAVLEPREQALVDYALRLTRAPATVCEEDVERLRAAGLADVDVLAVAEVTAYYAYANRIANGLGVSLENPGTPGAGRTSLP